MSSTKKQAKRKTATVDGSRVAAGTEPAVSAAPMRIVMARIADLRPAEYNPRQMTEAQDKSLRDSLREFGCAEPIIVNRHPDRDGVVVGGHQRMRIWRDMGNETIPTVEVNLTEKRERELNIRLNRNGGGWDMDALANEYEIEDLKAWGFEDYELTGDDEPDAEATSSGKQEKIKCPKCGHRFMPE